jgi:hypothetical protein
MTGRGAGRQEDAGAGLDLAVIAFGGVDTAVEVPAPRSGVVLIADPCTVEGMLDAFELGGADVTRPTLSRDYLAVLDAALSETPPAAA